MSSKSMTSLLDILKFTMTILLPRYSSSVFKLLSSFYPVKQQREETKLKLELWSVPEDAFMCLIPMNIEPSFLGNVDSSILVSFNTAQTLGISSSSWLKLKKNSEKFVVSNSSNSYLVHVIIVPDIEDSVAIVTNVLHYNITHALLLVNGTVQVEKFSELEHFVPNVATLTKVSLLQPSYDINAVLDTVLSCYFDRPHYLHVGDVFCVDVIKYAPSVTYLNSKLKTLYFKVLDIEGPHYGDTVQQCLTNGYYIMKGCTTLLQCTNEQGYVPCSDVTFIKGEGNITANNLKSHLLSTCPSGLDAYRDELLTCIQPYVLNVNRFDLKPLFLVCGPRGVGKSVVIRNVAGRLGLNVFDVDSFEVQGGSPSYAEGKFKHIFSKAQEFAPCVILLRNVEVLCRVDDDTENCRVITAFINEAENLFQEHKTLPVLLVATCNDKNKFASVIFPALARVFLHVVYMRSPDELQRAAMLQWLSKQCSVNVSIDLSHVAAETSGFLYADLSALVFHAIRNHSQHLKVTTQNDQNSVGVTLSKSDFEGALNTMHKAYSETIDAPKIPKVSWEDVGGLSDLKEEIMRTVTLPLQHPELLAAGLRRSGILLYGPPGTGKTLLAKAVATECSLNFLSVKGPELLNMYVGQSEENVREVFSRARAAIPCIIFFDELDSLAPNRGRSGDSGGVMDRVISQLLAELDGLQKSSHLFVIGATNRPDLIDPALLRPGRFDKLLYVGVAEDKETQLSIMMALTKRFKLRSDVKLKDVVSLLPAKLTGADLYSVCSHAWLIALRTMIDKLQHGGSSIPSAVEVGMEDFKEAVSGLTPSVSKEYLAYFQGIWDRH